MSRSLSILTLALLASVMLFAQTNTSSSAKGQKKQAAPAAQPVPAGSATQPVVGKTGEHAKAINTSTTATTGVNTPPVQTDNGMVQQPAHHPEVHPQNPNAATAPGAPPNWEQVGQDEQLANSNAAAAARAEIGGPEGTLGVGGALPSYSQSGKPTGSSQTRTNQSQPGQTQRNTSRATGNAVKKPAPPQ